MQVLTHTFTIDATPDYNSGDVVGEAKEFTFVFDAAKRSREFNCIVVRDDAGQAPAVTFYFFKTNALTGTYTDNSGVAFSSQDTARMIGHAVVASAAYSTAGGASIATVAIEKILGNETNDYESLFVVAVANGTYNAAAAADLSFTLGLEE